MVQELVCDYLRHMSLADFTLYKDAVEKVEKERYKEMWWTHERMDEYLYIIHYADGHTHLVCKGKEAYNIYEKDSDAIMVEGKTKDLFPTYKVLIRKEVA